jgi:CRP/FNR family cyclic AMP-dependent transcriptional regulator
MISTDDFRKDPSRAYKAGETVFREGDDGFVMYVVLDGAVKLSVTGRSVEKVVKGGVFGEMALIDSSPRSATAVAATDCTLVSVTAERFKSLIQETPGFALEIMSIMAMRLRSMDRRI